MDWDLPNYLLSMIIFDPVYGRFFSKDEEKLKLKHMKVFFKCLQYLVVMQLCDITLAKVAIWVASKFF